MKRYIIEAIAPTVYQLNSLRSFNIGCNRNGNGSFSGYEEFDTYDDAKSYLKTRAEKYNDEDPEGNYERLMDMYADINYGQLTLDAVTASIKEIEN